MGKNSETRTTRASFYKLLVSEHDFTSQIRVPPQFVKDHGKNLSEKVKLFTEFGNSPWIVKNEQIGRHRFFTDGWSRFAQDADLKSREFLLFNLIGKSQFDVSVYDTSACKKDYTLHSPENEYEFKNDQTDDVCGDGQNWSFVKKLTREHTSELEIPRDFAMGTGIVRNRKVKLRGVGKVGNWAVHVTMIKKKCGNKLVMRGGWNEFLRGNKIVVGSTICFDFVGGSGNVIAAKVVEEEEVKKKKKSTSDQLLLFRSAKRKRGRPPKLDAICMS